MAAPSSTGQGLVIGVDVGGTNTDAVLLDLSRPGTSAVLSSHKSPTTSDVTDGIEDTLKALLFSDADKNDTAFHEASSVSALAIGTTHFLNAIIQHDANVLSPVAVIRLGSFGFVRGALPFADWPIALRDILEGYSSIIPGGVNIDGKLVAPLDEEALRKEARTIHELGLRHVVVTGMGSPMDQSYHQEEAARDAILSELEKIDPTYAEGMEIVLSHTVAGSGLLARENASILNASILTFARRTIHSFIKAMRQVGLSCPLYLTSNAGHLLSFSEALSFPIRIFSSGPTNSMRGAAFLAREELNDSGKKRQGSCVVVDVGGTTTDVGALLPNGYPRLSKTYTELAGVKINLDMPSVESIGLGGGSIVRVEGPDALTQHRVRVTVGPDSVGHRLTERALCFGGNEMTATDAVQSVAGGLNGRAIGDPSLIKLNSETSIQACERIRIMFESLVDRIKLSADDCTIILVGGGSILCPESLKGVSKIIRSEYAGVANAIGAALAKVYGAAEAMVDADDVQTGIEQVKGRAIEQAVSRGGTAENIVVLNEKVEWVPYVDGKKLVHIEVACTADHAKVFADMQATWTEGDRDATGVEAEPMDGEPDTRRARPVSHQKIRIEAPVDLATYRPEILSTGEWVVSPTDLKFLEIGCYILGCGGGGSPYSSYLHLMELLREGERIAIVQPEGLRNDDVLPPVAAVGSPAVGLERIASDAVFHAIQRMNEEIGSSKANTHLLATEIGGNNGLGTLLWGAKRYCGVPIVDGDLMGRAYPKFEMVSQYVTASSINELLPVTICSGDGRGGTVPAGQKDETSAGEEIRKICADFGFAAGAVGNPLSGNQFREAGIPNTFSLAWRIGRVIRKAQVQSTVGSVTDALIQECGGQQSVRRIFTGKIRGVETRITETGHSLGEVVIARLGDGEVENEDDEPDEGWAEIRVPFMNENLAIVAKASEGTDKIIVSIPDLIFLQDISTGEALGVQEYRYGVKVVVVAMAPHPIWTTDRGLEIAGPGAFGLPYQYASGLKYHKPRSVHDEFGAKE